MNMSIISINYMRNLRSSYCICPREYWMIYEGPGFLAVAWFGSSPTPFPPLPSASCLYFSVFLCRVSAVELTDGRGGSGRGAKSDHRKKAWPSTNHSILSDLQHISPSPPYYFPYVKVLRPKSQWVQNLLLAQWLSLIMFCPSKISKLVLLFSHFQW